VKFAWKSSFYLNLDGRYWETEERDRKKKEGERGRGKGEREG
jgi:hypothetical protein